MVQDEAIKSISFQSDRSRRQILLSYWIVALLAVPLWWVTTSITRLPLPEGRVESLGSKQLTFALSASLGNSLANAVAKDVETSLLRRIHGLNLDETFSIYIFAGLNNRAVYAVALDRDADEIRLEGRKLIIGMKSLPPERIPDTISNQLSALWLETFRQDQRTVQFAARYRIAFTLLDEDASGGQCPLSWDVQEAIAMEIQPILQRLSVLHNFTIESQVQFFAPLGFQPVQLEDSTFGLTEEQLSVFVNSAEWTLSSSVSNDPVLHFVIFVPSANRRPLRILNDQGMPGASNAFVIPQWGSIFIYDSWSNDEHLGLQDLQPAFAIFRKQLMSLLGVPNLPPGVKSSEALPDWTLDALLRRRTYENAEGSKDTLRSIVNLVHQIEGMPIDKAVTEDVHEALNALDETHAATQDSPLATLQKSAKAFTRASRAFFNPGMLALLYFPPEHNLAVYTPLLAPVSVPLIAAVIRELARWQKTRRQATS